MPVSPRIPKATAAPAWPRFAALVGDIARRLDAEAGVLDVAALDGNLIGRVDLADVRAKFAAITWALTTRTFANGGQGGIASRYAGRRRRPADWRSARAGFHVDGFAAYAARGDEGLGYLALHETAHVTRLGLLVQDACWRKHLAAGGKPRTYPGSPHYVFNEQVANEVTRLLAARLAVPTLAEPTYGSPPTRLKVGVTR